MLGWLAISLKLPVPSCPFADVRPRVSVQAFVVFESPEEAQRACQKDRETFGDKFGDRYVRVYPTLESDVPDMQLAFQQQHMMQQVRQDVAAGCLQWIKAECTAAAAWSCGWRVGLFCAMAIKCVEHCPATGAAGLLSTPADQQLLRPCAAGEGDPPWQVSCSMHVTRQPAVSNVWISSGRLCCVVCRATHTCTWTVWSR